MKKILVLTTTYPRWENDTEPAFVENLCNELSSDFDVHVLTPFAPNSLKKENKGRVSIHRFWYFPRCFPLLAYDGGIMPKLSSNKWMYIQVPFLFLTMFISSFFLMASNRYSVIHAHWVLPQGLIALLVGKIFKSKVIVTSHGADLYSLKGKLLSKLKVFVFDSADRAIVVSNAMKEFCNEELNVNKNIEIASMGIDCKNLFKSTEEFNKRSGFVFVGRLVEKKGVDVLLNAFSKFLEVYPSEKLKIVGDGTQMDDLKHQADVLNIGRSVEFMGAVTAKEVSEILNQSKFSVMPSLIAEGGDQEGLGLVAAESLACGCITVVSDLPAINDVHNDPLLHFKPNNDESLLKSLLFIYENQKEALDASLKLKSKVEREYSWQAVGNNYKQLIFEVV